MEETKEKPLVEVPEFADRLELCKEDSSACDGRAMELKLRLYPESRSMTARLCYQSEENSTPIDEWSGLVIPFYCKEPDAVLIHEALRDPENQKLLARVCDGWEEYLENGSNYKGRLNDDARKASEELDEIIGACGLEDAGLFEAGEWFSHSGIEVSATATDAELQTMAEEFEKEARSDGYILTGCYEYLVREREEAIDNEELAAE